MRLLSDVATAIAGGIAAIGLIALLWASLGVFLGVAWNAFKWVTGA